MTPVGVVEALKIGVEQVGYIISTTFKFIGVIVRRARAIPAMSAACCASRNCPARRPASGLHFVVQLTAVLSVSIGLLNLFPIPLLDGGHLLFYAVEVDSRAAAV